MEQDVKYMFSIIIYFLILIFIVTVVNGVSNDFGLDTTYNNSGGKTAYETFTPYADSPRFANAEFSYFTSTYDVEHDVTPKYLTEAGLIYDNSSCESYAGFSWVEETIFLFIGTGSFKCDGKLDLSTYDPEGNIGNLSAGQTLADEPVCHMSTLNNSRPLAQKMGCTWYESIIDVQDGKGSFSVVWESLKDIATFNIAFPITNSFLNFILNFFLIGLPFIWLSVIVIIIIRKLVGFT